MILFPIIPILLYEVPQFNIMSKRTLNLQKVSRFQMEYLLPVLLLFLGNSLAENSSGVQFGDACDLRQPCDTTQGLACISNVCQCDSPSNQRFDNKTRKCVSVVGGPCSTSIVDDCIPNSFCAEKRDESGEAFTECQCEAGYIENSSGDCVPGIGQPCSYLPDECNPLGMVVCKNGKCQCLDELQVYDVDMKRCVSPAGTHCKYERAASSLQLGCVKNAICYPFFYWIPPKCLCKPGYVQTKSRQCVPESDYNKTQIGVGQGDSNNDNQAINQHVDANLQRNNPRAIETLPWHTSSQTALN